MAQVIWSEPALSDLDAIADYIALENPEAARALVQKVFHHVEQLAQHPKSGPKPPELPRIRVSIQARKIGSTLMEDLDFLGILKGFLIPAKYDGLPVIKC